MRIIRNTDLITICDMFINSKFSKTDVVDFAWTCLTSDEIEIENNENVLKTLYEWDNEDINYCINISNMSLWKDRLLNDSNEIDYRNTFAYYKRQQSILCEKYNMEPVEMFALDIVGISKSLEIDPIHALRHPKTESTSGWYIWSGINTSDPDFFKPHCAYHLISKRPDVLKYLGLPAGFRFIIDGKGYEDVWYDSELLNVR